MRTIVAGVNDGEVGIWWYTPDREIWKKSCPLCDAQQSSDFYQLPELISQIAEWGKVVNEYIEEKVQQGEVIDLDSQRLRTGEVFFYSLTNTYRVTCSAALVNDDQLRKAVIEAFHLSKDKVQFVEYFE